MTDVANAPAFRWVDVGHVDEVNRRRKFTVDIGGPAVRAQGARGVDNHGSNEPGIYVPHLLGVGVIHPEDGAVVARRRTRAFGDRPDIGVSPSRRDRVVELVPLVREVRVRCALRVLVIENAMRVQARGEWDVVAVDDADGITHLGPHQRA